MLVEQIITAGTVTEICIWQFLRSYRRLQRQHSQLSASDIEVARPPIGKLRVAYFKPGTGLARVQKAHIKCTIIDDEIVVLGSGNMDRASWYTSLELGVAIYGRDIIKNVWESVERGLDGRMEEWYGY